MRVRERVRGRERKSDSKREVERVCVREEKTRQDERELDRTGQDRTGQDTRQNMLPGIVWSEVGKVILFDELSSGGVDAECITVQ